MNKDILMNTIQWRFERFGVEVSDEGACVDTVFEAKIGDNLFMYVLEQGDERIVAFSTRFSSHGVKIKIEHPEDVEEYCNITLQFIEATQTMNDNDLMHTMLRLGELVPIENDEDGPIVIA